MAEIQDEFYQGWIIQIAQDQLGFRFYCWMVERQTGISDGQFYATVEAALRAGRLRADLETVRLALTSFLNGKRQFLLLHIDERNALENSIDRYIDTVKHQFS